MAGIILSELWPFKNCDENLVSKMSKNIRARAMIFGVLIGT